MQENTKAIILPENDNDPVAILLYGYIGENENDDFTSTSIVRNIKILGARYKNMDIRINSYGGEVYAGLGIFNAIRASRSNINIYIDGVAASMAAVIALCGRPVFMSRYARLMIHPVSGGIQGNAQQIRTYANEVENLTKTLVKIVAKKTGQTDEEVESQYFNGVDNWFSADEALKLKLIDGIFDVETAEDTEIEELKTDKDVYEFTNRLQQEPRKPKEQPQDKYKAFFHLAARTLNLANEQDTNKVLQALKPYVKYKETSCERDFARMVDLDENKKEKYRKLYFSNYPLYREMIDEELDNALKIRELMINNAIREGRCSHILAQKILENCISIPRDVLAMVLTIAPKSSRIKNYIEGQMTLEEYARFAPQALKDNPDLLKSLLDRAIEEQKQVRKLAGLSDFKNLDWYRKNNPKYLEDNPQEYKRLIQQEEERRKS